MCYRQNRKPVSVLTCHLSSRSTPRKRAGSPFVPWDSPVYMIFLVLVPSPPHVAIRRRELLPRGFTLTLFGRSVFCYGIHKITPICAFHSRMPFPVRTFLKRKAPATSHSTYISMNYLYPSFRSISSFCLFILSTSLIRAGVMSSQCLWHCIDFEYIRPMQKLLCVHPLQ